MGDSRATCRLHARYWETQLGGRWSPSNRRVLLPPQISGCLLRMEAPKSHRGTTLHCRLLKVIQHADRDPTLHTPKDGGCDQGGVQSNLAGYQEGQASQLPWPSVLELWLPSSNLGRPQCDEPRGRLCR